MSTNVAINGLGRIGRAILKLVIDEPSVEVVAVNDLVGVENLAYLLRFDIGRRIGFRKAVMTTVHAYTSSQSIVDGPSMRFRRGRAAAANLVPTATGAAHATTRALPEYAGRFDGIAIRAPIPVGSIADITFVTLRKTTVDEVNRVLAEEADTGRYAGVLGVSHDPLVSSDTFHKHP